MVTMGLGANIRLSARRLVRCADIPPSNKQVFKMKAVFVGIFYLKKVASVYKCATRCLKEMLHD